MYSLQERDRGCQTVGWELVAHPQDETDRRDRKLKREGGKKSLQKV